MCRIHRRAAREGLCARPPCPNGAGRSRGGPSPSALRGNTGRETGEFSNDARQGLRKAKTYGNDVRQGLRKAKTYGSWLGRGLHVLGFIA